MDVDHVDVGKVNGFQVVKVLVVGDQIIHAFGNCQIRELVVVRVAGYQLPFEMGFGERHVGRRGEDIQHKYRGIA